MAGYHAYPQLWIDNGDEELCVGGIRPRSESSSQLIEGSTAGGAGSLPFAPLKKVSRSSRTLQMARWGSCTGNRWGRIHVAGSRDTDPDGSWQAYQRICADDQDPKVPLKFTTSLFFRRENRFMSIPKRSSNCSICSVVKNWGETAEYEVYYNDSGSILAGASPVTPYPPMKNLNASGRSDPMKKWN